jgi:hypothetical protein
MGKSVQIELAAQSVSVMNWAPQRALAVLCDCLPGVSQNPA